LPTSIIEKPFGIRAQGPARIPVLPEILEGEGEARRIIAVCRHFSALPLEGLKALQLGSSRGIMTEALAPHFQRVIALDRDSSRLQLARRISRRDNIHYLCTDGSLLPLLDNSVDVIICDRFLENTTHQKRMMAEIYRVLKYEGFCYFGATSKYTVMEREHLLPFLSWLPHPLAELYFKLAGRKGRYDSQIPSLKALNKMTEAFWRHDYTRIIRRNPEAFYSEDMTGPNRLGSKITLAFFKHFYPFLPTWIWVLTKRR